jgi:hypothetical protein
MPPPIGNNWELFMENQVLHGPEEIDLTTLEAGDQLTVITKHTRYAFEWLEGGGLFLRTSRTDRPSGLVTRPGCAFRRSGIVVPNVVFRGGLLDYFTLGGQVHHRTTVITSHTLLRREARHDLREPVFQATAR